LPGEEAAHVDISLHSLKLSNNAVFLTASLCRISGVQWRVLDK